MNKAVLDEYHGNDFSLYNGDSIEITSYFDEESIDYIIYSPPFLDLYVYSDSDRDLGNNKNHDDFYKQFKFLAENMYKMLKSGRLMSVHCMNIPLLKSKNGYLGIKDFRGDLIRLFEEVGFIFHSEVTIWKDPLIEATRTKSIGLLHKQLQKDSTVSRNGFPDYVITMRKRGENEVPVRKPEGMNSYAGSTDINVLMQGNLSHNIWRAYASPVWMDIRQTNTLNRKGVKSEDDIKHIAPLQLDVIERLIQLYTNKNEVVFTPFLGIGSEVYKAVEMNRKGVGIELKPEYFKKAIENCKYAEENKMSMDLF